MIEPRLKLYDHVTGKIFYKYFDTEFERDKFKRKLRFSAKLSVLFDNEDRCYYD